MWSRLFRPIPPPRPTDTGASFHELIRYTKFLRDELKRRRTTPDSTLRARIEAALLDIREVLGAHPLNDDLVRLNHRLEEEFGAVLKRADRAAPDA